MQILIDHANSRPIYRQVSDELRRLIAGGQLREGAALPPVRQLAADLGVNLNTVATAYRELQDDGLVRIRHGAGAEVAAAQTRGASEKDMRRDLRLTLTQLMLAGFKRREILEIVADELGGLKSGTR